MTEYYYQIKGKVGEGDYSWGNWQWPPIFTGKVEADSKKEARALIDVEYGKQFPMRVPAKDLDSNEFLLKIVEIKDSDEYIKRLFVSRKCKQCENRFKIIDKYNDSNCEDKSPDFCCGDCKRSCREIERFRYNENANLCGDHFPVIYRITHKTEQKCYIGKTTQAFTLRWYQHFYQAADECKFHEAINDSIVTDWIFEIVEIIKLPEDIKEKEEVDNFILERERWHIWANKSVDNGYNSVVPIGEKADE